MRKPALALILLLAGALVSGAASAHGRARIGIGFHFGAPLWSPWSPWYWGPPAYHYYPAPVYVTPAEPPVYVERSEVDASRSAERSQSSDWWYYCEASRGYYPYVKTCPSGWQRVPPAPPPG